MSSPFIRAHRWLATAAPIALTAALGASAHAEDASGAAAAESGAVAEELVVTGIRGQPRSVADSPVPIDVIGPAQITATGRVGLKQILASAIPSLTLPAQNGGGTSASVPPFAVQGLTGDYVLVLVNGKRRHPTALINNLATLGGGSTPVDLDLIPASAIERVEYLRNGAAAQYGSDAIAGVINIILKGSDHGGGSETTVGQTYKSTGKLIQQNLDWGQPFFGGAIHYALSAFQQGPAPANDPAGGVLYPLVKGALDPREATGDRDYGRAYGRSTLNTTVNFAYDLHAPVGRDWNAYSFSTFSYRQIKDARGAFRPDDLSSLPQIYPDGFQAYRRVHEYDFQATAGVKGPFAGWSWDLSSSFGRDWAKLGGSNTLNASLGPTVGQTSFYLGKQIFEQWTNNLDATRSFEIGLAKPLDVSWGFEHRWEQFEEVAGEPNSYINGGYQVPRDGTPFGDLYGGRFPQAGLQSFTGTTPADASTHHRNNLAVYLDLGTNLTEAWYVGLAGRGEHYDDSSGDSLSGKFTTRYEILPHLALRGSVNNGFHAPSLAEQWFSTTQNTTVVVNGQGVLAQTKFLPVDNPVARALGATPLSPETSINYSIGLTWEPTSRLRFTIDAYQIDIRNRIVKSSPNFNLSAAQVAALGFPGLSSAQFFVNGVNTRTRGIDAVAEYQQSLGDFGNVQWSATYSGNGTEITRINANAANFNALAQRQLVEQTPRYRLTLAGDWSYDRWEVRLQNTLYGRYEEPVNNTTDAVFHPKWVTDLDVSFRVSPRVKLAVGANNLFDVFPSRAPASVLAKTANVDSILIGAPGYTAAGYGVPTQGYMVYGQNAPWGLLGGFYYARIGVEF